MPSSIDNLRASIKEAAESLPDWADMIGWYQGEVGSPLTAVLVNDRYGEELTGKAEDGLVTTLEAKTGVKWGGVLFLEPGDAMHVAYEPLDPGRAPTFLITHSEAVERLAEVCRRLEEAKTLEGLREEIETDWCDLFEEGTARALAAWHRENGS